MTTADLCDLGCPVRAGRHADAAEGGPVPKQKVLKGPVGRRSGSRLNQDRTSGRGGPSDNSGRAPRSTTQPPRSESAMYVLRE